MITEGTKEYYLMLPHFIQLNGIVPNKELDDIF